MKAGETVVVAGTKGDNPVRMTATTLVANMEFILSMLARRGGAGAAGAGAAGAGAGGGGFDLGLGLP